ncbi:MAG: hypothetical protein H5T86_09620, partial [Armatimonadetes bacterium]|nr:hypothetical protein [Armatimonadota bacterium]
MSSPLRVVLLPILLLFGGQAVSAPLLSVNGRATGLPVHVTAGRLMVDPGRLAELTGVTVADGVVSWFDNTVRLAPAQHKTQATGDKSLCNDVDLRAVAQALGWRVSASEAEVQVWGPGASVLGVRQGQHADRIRVVLDLSGLCVFQTEQSGQTITLLVPPGEGSVATAGELRLFEFSGERAARVTTEVLEDGWTKVLVSAPVQGRWRVFTLADPPRIVVDLVFPEATEGEAFKKETAQPPAQRREAKPEKPESGGPGRQLWRVIQWPTDAGPAYVHVVTVDPVREVEIRPALAGPVVNSLASVPAIAKAHGAIAAINGGFFSPRHGVPLGMLVINGEWLRAPLPERPVLAIMRDGRCEISRVRWEAWLHFTGLGSLPVLGLNQNHWERDSIVVYTHRWADTVPGVSDATRLIVSSAGRVI